MQKLQRVTCLTIVMCIYIYGHIVVCVHIYIYIYIYVHTCAHTMFLFKPITYYDNIHVTTHVVVHLEWPGMP